jgi:hypothetical protein
MKVTGFTFIRNAIKYDYPVVEAITSILPICDEFVVAVGRSDDETLALIQAIDPSKIRIIETIWDETQRKGGRVLAMETDKAFQAIGKDTDWCFYVQGDEVVHERDHANIVAAMQLYKDNSEVDGLLFNFRSFYGSYDYVADSYDWVRREVRVLKNNKAFYSYGDALGFRKNNNEKLRAKPIDATIYHYGWVRPPKTMQAKMVNFQKLWHNDQWIEEKIKVKESEFDYGTIQWLSKYKGDHPSVMKARMEKVNWTFDFDVTKRKTKLKYRIKRIIEKLTGVVIGEFRNYKIV